jgi:mannose-6-phosphate isomerase-like protein (cupin superfamily)
VRTWEKFALVGFGAAALWYFWPRISRGFEYPKAMIFPTGTLYLFKGPRVIIPPHVHPEGRTHYTLVLQGTFSINRGDECFTIGPKDCIDFAPGEPHSIEALEPGAIFNGYNS